MVNEYTDLFKGLFEGVYIVDKNRKIIFWNSGSEQITGYTYDEVVNEHCFQNILRHVDKDGKELCFDGCPLHRTLETGEQLENQVFLHHKKGHRIPVTVRTFPLYNDDNEIVAAVEVFTDMDYRKNMYTENRRLQELIITDELTNVYNRRYIDFQLKTSINESVEFNSVFGIIFIDIDDFKNINDTYGHNVGDEVLKLISETVNSNIRSKDIFGRWGGEEFIVLAKVRNVNEIRILAEKLRMLVKKSSITHDGKEIRVTISLGATLYKENDTPETIVDRADRAMYQSKNNGKNQTNIL